MGADARTDGHHASIRGREQLSSAPVWSTDIRAGAGLVLAGLAAEGVTEVHEVSHIDRGYPHFVEDLQKLGGDDRAGRSTRSPERRSDRVPRWRAAMRAWLGCPGASGGGPVLGGLRRPADRPSAAATRLLMVKADGSVLVHSDGGSYKPLNWMSPPCWLTEEPGRWIVQNKAGEELVITIEEVLHDFAARPRRRSRPGEGRGGGAPAGAARRARRDPRRRLVAGAAGVPDADRSGRPDVPGRDGSQRRRGGQAPRRDRRRRAADPISGPAQPRPAAGARVTGVFAAQQIKPQARTLAADRGISA